MTRPDALRAALTDEVLRRVGERLVLVEGARDRCDCNRCNCRRREAREILIAALAHAAPTPEPLDRAAIILAAVEQLMLPHRTGMAPYEVLQRSAYNRALADVLRLLTGGTDERSGT